MIKRVQGTVCAMAALWVLGGGSLVGAAGAQTGRGSQTPVAAMSGSVSGTVTFGDTQRPARFAKVMLTPVSSDTSGMEALQGKDLDKNPMAALGALMGSVTMLNTQTDLEGHFELTDVAPGSYYVLATVPGYVSPATNAMFSQSMDLTGAPVVKVEPNHQVRSDVSLERGAVIAGKVTFEDGSPVTGAMVTIEPAAKPEKKAKGADDEHMDFGGAMMIAMSGMKVAQTDDQGRYRVAGLPAGDYHVQVTVSLAGGLAMRNGVMHLGSVRQSKMEMFAPGTEHAKDAAKVTVKAGDDQENADIAVNLTGMHSVSGYVSSAVDHHRINAGQVTLTDATDKDVQRTASIGPDGSFTVSYVPPGSYTLKVSDGADTAAAPQKKATGLLNFQQDKIVKSYEEASQPAVVAASDVTGVSVEVKPSDKVKTQPDLGSLFGGGKATE